MNIHHGTLVKEFQWIHRPGLTGHLMAITHFYQTKTLEKLSQNNRFGKLTLAYEPYIGLLVQKERSPGELAQLLGTHKQACSKMLKTLEKQKLVGRRKNPADSRSSIVFLTDRGVDLVKVGMQANIEIQQNFQDKVGTQKLLQLCNSLERLCSNLELQVDPYLQSFSEKFAAPNLARLNLCLYKLSNYCYNVLIDDLNSKGFKGLKPHFGHVLGLIRPEGARIQQIASMIGVSKQSVAVLAQELESLNYIAREKDSDDKRQMILRLTPHGQQLLSEAKTSVSALEQSFEQELSSADFDAFRETLETLYLDVIDNYENQGNHPNKIHQLSQKLLKELGATGARALAQQILILTRGAT